MTPAEKLAAHRQHLEALAGRATRPTTEAIHAVLRTVDDLTERNARLLAACKFLMDRGGAWDAAYEEAQAAIAAEGRTA